MFSILVDIFSSPKFDSFEKTQKARFLYGALILLTIGCLLLGLQNTQDETNLDLVLFAVSGLTFLSIPLIKRGGFNQIAIFISLLLYGVITFSLIDGVGLRDAGMIAYAVFIIFTAFLFDSRIAILSAILSIFSVSFVYYLEINNRLNPPEFSSQAQLMVINILLLVVGVLVMLITRSWAKSMLNIREAYDLTLEGWAKVLEYRDFQTEGHSQRVTVMTMRLAKHMNIPAAQLKHVRRGAMLHDVGKMAVPDMILLKPGALTPEERLVVEKHPEDAIKMLKRIPFLRQALEIPYSHHERWDGSGYPQKLSGEDIPLTARIFAVVDVWDALLSDRPYRKAWSQEDTYQYFKDNAGAHFDPAVVQAFFEILPDMGTRKTGNSDTEIMH